MDSIRILHCADLHIGAECGFLGTKARSRKAEVKKTFQRILELCKEERTELLLIAGDLFDDVKVSSETLGEIRDSFGAMPECKVVIAAGNHDAATPDSPYMLENFWPENVILFTSQPECRVLPELGVRLVGAGFTGMYCYQSMLRKLPSLDDSLINIGVMHGDIVSDNSRSDYNAVTQRAIQMSGLDYLALGHIHKRTEVLKAGNTYYAYPGCPEGQGFDETGDKGVYVGTVEKGYCNLQYRSICIRRVTELSVDVTDIERRDALAARLRSCMEAENGEGYEEHIYRLTLTGEPKNDMCRNIEDILAELEDIWYLKIKNKTRPRINPEELVQENSLRGIYVKRMTELMGTVPEEQRETALRLGLRAFFGEINIE